LRAALTRAFQHRRIDSEAEWRRVAYFKNTQSPAPRPIDPTVIELFRSNCSIDLRWLVDAALYTGCRAVELRRLKCRDLIHEGRKLVVPPAKRSSGRTIVLSDDGYTFFAKLADHRKGNEDLVRRKNGRGWTRGAMNSQMYRTARRHLETAVITFHALRHTYATRLRDGGMPLDLIAKQLGHKHLRTTEHYYVGLDENTADTLIREALDSI